MGTGSWDRLRPPHPGRAEAHFPAARSQDGRAADRRAAQPTSLDYPPGNPAQLVRRRVLVARLLPAGSSGAHGSAPSAPAQAASRSGPGAPRHRPPAASLKVAFPDRLQFRLATLCGRLSVGKGVLELLRSWSVRPCVRPFDAALRAAGHNALIAAYRAPTNCAHSRCRVEAGSPGPAVSTGLLHQFNSPCPTS